MFRIKFNQIVNVSILIASLILNGCSDNIVASRATPVVDRSFITGEICNPPCWYGSEINKSTKRETLLILGQQPFVKSQSLKEYETYWTSDIPATAVQYDCVTSESRPCGILTFHEGILVENWIAVNYDLMLESVIQRLGAPDYLTYFWPNPSGVCEISVLWIEKGTSVSFDDRDKYNECENIIDGNKLSPDILVKSVLYTSKDVLVNSINITGGCCETIKWTGFKSD